MGTDRICISSPFRIFALSGLGRGVAIALLLVFLCSGFERAPRPAAAADAAIVIEGARIWDGSGKAPIQDGVLVITGDRIQAVGPRGAVSAPAGARTVSGKGKVLIPGFIFDWDILHLEAVTVDGVAKGGFLGNIATPFASTFFLNALIIPITNSLVYTALLPLTDFLLFTRTNLRRVYCVNQTSFLF